MYYSSIHVVVLVMVSSFTMIILLYLTGNVKAIWTGNDPDHYMKRMEKKKVPLLHDYAPVSIEAIADYLEGRSVMGDAGKEIYLIRNRTKCTFGSYELFLKLGFIDRVGVSVLVCHFK